MGVAKWGLGKDTDTVWLCACDGCCGDEYKGYRPVEPEGLVSIMAQALEHPGAVKRMLEALDNPELKWIEDDIAEKLRALLKEGT